MAFDKKEYWKNRKDGKRGQGELEKLPSNAITQTGTIGFTNSGEMVMKNRAYRRTTVSLFPKSSQLRKKKVRK